MNKRGESLSINVIITAAIALVVLIVLLVIFTSKIGQTVKGIESCTNAGGTCEEVEDCNLAGQGSEYAIGTEGCLRAKGEGHKCCIAGN